MFEIKFKIRNPYANLIRKFVNKYLFLNLKNFILCKTNIKLNFLSDS